jgi:hypothetical protein
MRQILLAGESGFLRVFLNSSTNTTLHKPEWVVFCLGKHKLKFNNLR